MNDFLSIYTERRQEINDFLVLINFLENKEKSTDDDGISEFDKFFYNDEVKINMTYHSLINIMKANVSLMIYNIIEYTTASLMDIIYIEIQNKQLSYLDVNNCIRSLWKKNMLKAASDPNSNFSTFIKKNDEIIEFILRNRVIALKARDNLPAGNLSALDIKELFGNHGMNLNIKKEYFRPVIMDKIKTDRNNLAHGSVSFTEALRDSSIGDLKRNYTCVEGFLDELIVSVQDYINKEEYRELLEASDN